MKSETTPRKPSRPEPKRKRANGDLKTEIGQLKRERIIDAAVDQFAEHGYHGVSVESVADSLGVTKPFIYYTFRDKNELLVAICRRAADLTVSAMQTVDEIPASPLDRLEVFCRRLANIILDNTKFLAVYTREEPFLPEKERIEIEGLRGLIDRHVCKLLVGATRDGDADVRDPRTTATAITTMISALWYWYGRKRKPADRDETIETVVTLAMRMAGAKPKARTTMPEA